MQSYILIYYRFERENLDGSGISAEQKIKKKYIYNIKRRRRSLKP